jgi:hypothetical protein
VVKFSWRSVERKGEGELLELAKERKVEGVAKLIYHYDITNIAELRSGLTFGTYYQYPSDDATSLAPKTGSQPPSLHRQALGVGPPNPTSRKRPASTTSHLIMRKKTKLSGEVSTEAGEASTEAGEASTEPGEASTEPGEASTEPGEASAEPGGASNSQDGTLPKCKTDLTDTDSKPFQNRIFSCLTISPAGRPLRDYNNVKEFLEAFRDAIRGHQSLYNDGSILHRDVSENNLIIVDGSRPKGWKGMLIDLDLGKERDSEPSGARFRTGTMQFMAIEVLNGLSHTYRHDLESFFYVFLWICIRRGWESYSPSKIPEDSLLTGWYTGSYREIARAKKSRMLKSDFREILDSFPPTLSHLTTTADEIRGILFPMRDDDLFIGTPANPTELYDPIIQALENAINIL